MALNLRLIQRILLNSSLIVDTVTTAEIGFLYISAFVNLFSARFVSLLQGSNPYNENGSALWKELLTCTHQTAMTNSRIA